MSAPFKIGTGYDIHRFAPGRRLVLGGVEIPSDEGLDGHSDADCLTHALADAVLGALGLPDIGHFFPNDDPDIEGIDSQKILQKSVQEADRRGYKVGNVDLAIIAEKPKLAPHIDSMKAVLAESLEIEPDCVGLKATTNEKIGDLGRAMGIAAHAVCLLIKK
ncbi:2-C-methyl-D-erythritol 2,4-cyclodiphosphate synthase [Rubellicoccus peritrichatus]|uniref:2-C-methyl-D-erythritol 2,4-cyclodiphosphate synthase n=1 Tax=Rubellicoccus peritrichatus TaxID=3080537 RepID=A0AAQ3LCJ7_9BACT|nr:2-C-methyl-D-erythritol 2,4-cyclodiphosphate synthase [Puniceicoccus sp. CR14]WOO41395.1 2-C-methyl-D-erythritol 2,4-cyclodiphosphate synthase [Puniceicoccus sp. CR14]